MNERAFYSKNLEFLSFRLGIAYILWLCKCVDSLKNGHSSEYIGVTQTETEKRKAKQPRNL